MRVLLVLLVAAALGAAIWLWGGDAFAGNVAPPAPGGGGVRAPNPPAAVAAGDAVADVSALPPAPPSPAPVPAGAAFVVEAADGAPVAGAIVTAVAGERELASVATDVRGEVRVRDVVDPFDYVVAAPGFLPRRGHRGTGEVVTRVVLAAAPRLYGHVVDTAGAPMAGARAVLLPSVAGRLAAPPSLPPSVPTAFTDADGRFALPWPDDAPRDVVVTAVGCAPFVASALPATARGDGELSVRLHEGARVVGVARARDGGPLAGVSVELWASAADDADLAPTDGGRLAEVRTDAHGAFAFVDLPGADFAVVGLTAEHGGSAARVALRPGLAVRADLVAVEPAQVRGTVVDAAPGARAFLYGPPRFLHTAAIAGDGTFAFDAVSPGRYLVGTAVPPLDDTLRFAVAARRAGAASLAIEIDLAAGERLDLRLGPPAVATGVLVGAASVGGLPAVGHRVVVRPAAGAGADAGVVRTLTLGDDAAFACDGLPPGDLDVELRDAADERPLVTQTCRVFAGQATRVTLIAP